MRVFRSLRCQLPPASRKDWLRNDSGATAIEFAIVGMPFLLFVLGLLGIGLYFMTSTSLEYGAQAATRRIRTGQAEKEAVTVSAFKQSVCAASSVINCNKLSVLVQHADDWSGISPRACVDENGNMVGSTGNPNELLTKYSGTSDEVVLVTLCYEWDLASRFGFLKLGGGKNGSGPAIIQAATAFKNEPY